ncbi:MAG: hypothetical protein JW769_03495 [Parachlamydiales bacterium]|nr:hypothetical protein [Parachlamydiales bacterium]
MMHQNIKMQKKMLITQKMSLGLHILELPLEELEHYLFQFVDKNPLLIHRFKTPHCSLQDNFSSCKISFTEYLLHQARLCFKDPKEAAIAETIILHLDDQQYFSPVFEKKIRQTFSISSQKIKKIITLLQEFDPPGIASPNLQTRLLQQIDPLKEPLITVLLQKYFNDFLHKRWYKLSQELKIDFSLLRRMRDILYSLTIHPKDFYESSSPKQYPRADVRIFFEKDLWNYEILDTSLFCFWFNMDYLSHRHHHKHFFQRYISSACFYKQSLLKRREILTNLLHYIMEKQKDFFSLGAPLKPLTLKKTAQDLGYSYSTIYRAIAKKYALIEKTFVPLSYFFPSALTHHPHKMQVIHWMEHFIKTEDKKKPLSDKMLYKKLQEHGIECPRRTIAKYRKQIQIFPSFQRQKIPL